MKEIPIIFQPEIIKNILDGVCSLSFRVIKPQPSVGDLHDWEWKPAGMACSDGYFRERSPSYCPYGQAGDRLWLRETHRFLSIGSLLFIGYKADNSQLELPVLDIKYLSSSRWRPSIHMPRWASRIMLERTEPAYVTRTLEITEEEARACGFVSDAVIVDTPAGADYTGHFALDRYWAYWDLINKARGFPFADNVWVWGVPFGAMSYRGK